MSEQIQTLDEICDEFPLKLQFEEDARYTWPDRWKAAQKSESKLTAERDELAANLEKVESLLIEPLQRIATQHPINDEPLATDKCLQARDALRSWKKLGE